MSSSKTFGRGPLIGLGLLAAGALLVAIVAVVPTWVVALTIGTDVLSDPEWASAVAEERRTILFVLGGLIAAGGLWYTRQRQELDRDANRTNRFGAAIDQIGNPAAEVRMGGLYSLERIGRDSVRDRAVVTEVISAFVRSRTHERIEQIEALKEDWRLLPLTVDVLAALSILTRQSTGVGYARPDLEWAIFNRCELEKLDLSGANLAQARFAETVMSQVSMAQAALSYSVFHKAALFDIDFTSADLQGGTFNEANLSNCNFTNANLLSAKFLKARLDSRIRFDGADLTWADFTGMIAHPPLDLTVAASVRSLIVSEVELPMLVLTEEQREQIHVTKSGAAK